MASGPAAAWKVKSLNEIQAPSRGARSPDSPYRRLGYCSPAKPVRRKRGAEEAINAVLNRIIRSIKGNVVSMDVVAAGHSDDRAILVANLALIGVVVRHRGGGSDSMARE